MYQSRAASRCTSQPSIVPLKQSSMNSLSKQLDTHTYIDTDAPVNFTYRKFDA